MTWWHYLLLVNLYLLLFYGFYMLLLRNETFFQLNRIYLVAGALLSFVIPVIQSQWIQQLFITQRVQQTIYSTIYHPQFVYQAKPAAGLNFTIGQIFAAVYISGAIFLLARLFLQLISVKNILAGLRPSAAFSFFGKISVDGTLPGRQTIITHEQVHVNQWHSADVLFIEAVMIINWFNPVVYFYRKAIKHVHEFIADKKAIESGTPKTEYAYLLLSQTFGAAPHQLTNNFFNKSLLKRRIIMLNKDESKRRKLLKYGLSAPLFAAMLILSSATVKNSDVISIINKKTEQIFLMNTLPARQTLRQVTVNASKVWPDAKLLRPKQIRIDINDSSLSVGQMSEPKVNRADSQVFDNVEVQPEFPGGEVALGKFLQENLQYPQLARLNGVQGKVYIRFIVQKNGGLNDIKVIRDPGSGLGDEAARVLAESPKWVPGVQNGSPVNCAFTLPVNFSLNTAVTRHTDTANRVVVFNKLSLTHLQKDGAPAADTNGANHAKTVTRVFVLKRTADNINTTYFINGKEVSPEQVATISPDIIKSIRVTKQANSSSDNAKLNKATIAIVLKDTKAGRQ